MAKPRLYCRAADGRTGDAPGPARPRPCPGAPCAPRLARPGPDRYMLASGPSAPHPPALHARGNAAEWLLRGGSAGGATAPTEALPSPCEP